MTGVYLLLLILSRYRLLLERSVCLLNPLILSMDTKPDFVSQLSKVGLEEQSIQIAVGSESGKSAEVLEGRVHDKAPRDVKEKVFVDNAIGCFAGVKVMDASTQDFGPCLLVWSQNVIL